MGVVTQTDLANLNDIESLGQLTVGEIMTPHPVAVGSHDSLEDILFLFSRYKFTWLPVIYRDKLEGIILQSDVLKAVFAEEDKTVGATHITEDKNGNRETDENIMPAPANDAAIDKGQ